MKRWQHTCPKVSTSALRNARMAGVAHRADEFSLFLYLHGQLSQLKSLKNLLRRASILHGLSEAHNCLQHIHQARFLTDEQRRQRIHVFCGSFRWSPPTSKTPEPFRLNIGLELAADIFGAQGHVEIPVTSPAFFWAG